MIQTWYNLSNQNEFEIEKMKKPVNLGYTRANIQRREIAAKADSGSSKDEADVAVPGNAPVGPAAVGVNPGRDPVGGSETEDPAGDGEGE